MSADRTTSLTAGELRELASSSHRVVELARTLGVDVSALSSASGRIAAADRKIARAIQDVPVPANLASRIAADCARIRREERHRLRPRRWAIAMTATAAALLLTVVMQPFGRPAVPADAFAGKIAAIHAQLLDPQTPLEFGLAEGPIPPIVRASTIVGHHSVELFGRSVVGYQLRHGASQAVLLMIPVRQFPYRIPATHSVMRDSTQQVDIHTIVSAGQVCVLVVRDGTEASVFWNTADLA